MCQTFEECRPPAGDPGTPPADNQPPCVPVVTADGITLECDSHGREGWDWGYYIHAWAVVPPHRVQIRPFPRWLVALEGTMSLTRSPDFSVTGGPEGAGLAEGFWSAGVNLPLNLDLADPDPGDIRDYRIGVRWRMLRPFERLFGGNPVPESCWNFDEREWNIAGGYAAPGACGDAVTHAYETSSWGKPENGGRFVHENSGCARVPSEPGEWTLPAYQVRVPTYWTVEWADEWYVWAENGWEWEDTCFYRAAPPIGQQWANCDGNGDGVNDPDYYRLARPKYEWVHQRVGWYPLDLRPYGYPQWYYESWAVVTTGAGEWCPFEYADPNPGDTVRIPVIEVQTVIVDWCRLDGTCGNLEPQTPW